MKRLNLFFALAILANTFVKAQLFEKKDSLIKDFQVTFISPIGTNGSDSYKYINRLSINIFAGISKGLEGIELGGFANVITQHVKGIQMAGFTNVVLKNVNGTQLAGYVNYSGGNFTGLAGSGFCNVNMGHTKGAQCTGFVNFNKDSLCGAQLSGFTNVNLGEAKGVQLSGFVNYNHKNVKGVQGSGFSNICIGNIEGAQLSGFTNVALGNLDGIQVSGFFNSAKKVKGTQVGLINIADSIDGAAIGLLSIVKKGLHQLEVSADELFYTNLAFRTGTHKFYNVFSTGFSPSANSMLWHIGYGIGTSFKVNENLRSDLCLSASHVSKGLFYNATNEVYKLYWGMEYKLAKKCFVAAGPTFNLQFSDALLPDFKKSYSNLAPYSFMNETSAEGFNYKAWLGAKVAIRFL